MKYPLPWRKPYLNLLYVQPRTILSEPILPLAVVGHHLVNLIPERLGMVTVVKVAKLVYHNVINDGLGSHHTLPVEGEPSARRIAGSR